MPRSLAAGHRRVTILTTKPANLAAPTLTELSAGLHASCRILADGYSLGPGQSDTVTEASLCDEIAPKVMTNGTWGDGQITVFRYWDSTNPGKSETTGTGDEIGDAVFQAVKVRGANVWIVDRFTGKKATDAWAADDECRVFAVQPDAWNEGEATGYIKAVVPLIVNGGEINAKVATTP